MRRSAFTVVCVVLTAASAQAQQTALDLTIGGRAVPQGKYSLYALHDLTRIDVRKRTLSAPLESFSIWLIPTQKSGSPTGERRLAWGDTELSADWNVVLR